MEINLLRFVLDFCALAVGKSGSPVTKFDLFVKLCEKNFLPFSCRT